MNKYKIALLLIIILFQLFLTVDMSFATNGSEQLNLGIDERQEPKLNETLKVGGLLLRYIISVLGILILTYWAVKTFARRTNSFTEYGEWIQVLDYMPLGNNRGFYLVEIEGKGLVLGITEQQINILATIDEQERLDELRGLSLRKKQPEKFTLNLWTKKKDHNFQKSLQEHILKTRNIYNKHKKGDKIHEE